MACGRHPHARNSLASAHQTTSPWRRCGTSSTGRPSSTPGDSKAFTRASSSTRSTERRHSQIFTEANALLDKIIAEKLITARGVYGFFPANAVGDDVELYTDNTRTKVQTTLPLPPPTGERREGSEPCRSLSDFMRQRPVCRIISALLP